MNKSDLSASQEYVTYLHWHYRRNYQAFVYWLDTKQWFWWKIRRLKRKGNFYTYQSYTYCMIIWHYLLLITTWTTTPEIIHLFYVSCWLYWLINTYIYVESAGLYDMWTKNSHITFFFKKMFNVKKPTGYMVLVCWWLWTVTVFTFFWLYGRYLFNDFIFARFLWTCRHNCTFPIIMYSYIKTPMSLILNFFSDLILTNYFIITNYITLTSLQICSLTHGLGYLTNFNLDTFNTLFLWFPWMSFYNYNTLFGLIFLLTLMSIYSTDNVYYVVSYTIFVVFLLASLLITLDLDIFAGFLVLIESVVILMFFFLIIYLTPNIDINVKNYKWKFVLLTTFSVSLISSYTHVFLSCSYFQVFALTTTYLDDYYESLHEVNINDLTGLAISLYWTNSILLVIIGLLLLIGSIICVVLVSFFTRMRIFNFKTFLDFFEIGKTCYSFIFLRKQNLSKQGRSTVSTKIFTKKSHDTLLHEEYKNKHDVFKSDK